MRNIFSSATVVGFVLLLSGSAYADVSTRLQTIGSVAGGEISLRATVDKSAPRVLSDSIVADPAFSQVSAFASSDLGTGELKVDVRGFPIVFFHNGFLGDATATLTDKLTIAGPGGAPIAVSFVLGVDGSLLAPAGIGAGTTDLTTFGFVRATVSAGTDLESASLQRRTTYSSAGNLTSDTFTGFNDWAGATPLPGTSNFVLALQLDTMITPGQQFDFSTQLFGSIGISPSSFVPGGVNTLGINTDIVTDFGQTALLSVVLPQGYTIASESGVFLAGPVPEPSGWLLMGVGCILVLAYRRRRSVE